ncbi:hypothetical protein Pan44_03170 [Caulifigura coniformis]|uniref:PDZ domain-containing protein n=1 Tax=Caulifigura coniformis TaxID=2527983 RepID=A0A517S848_9PLAN|nr:hypothetical protein [Caulifigura coniformis]QDT52308.1 hypothetical protein Pan44_03170 [Caulifigura coniformis]
MRIDRQAARQVATLFVALACFITSISGRAVAEDPFLKAATTEFPEFRKIVAPADYSARLSEAADSLKSARKDAAAPWPTAGVTVTTVFPESQAAIAGVQEGDIVIRFDDWTVWNAENFPRSPEQPQKCEYFSPTSRRRKSFTAQPGPLGVKCSNFWRPELGYLRGKSSNAKWDADVHLAITSAAHAPDLAETAWSYAIEKGYRPDSFAATSGIVICFAQGRSDAAWEFASLAGRAEATGDAEVHPLLLFRAAAANYQLREMLRLTERYPLVSPMNSTYVQLLMDLHLRRPAAERELPPPHVLAESMHRDDLRSRLIPQRQTTATHRIGGLKSGESLTVKTEPGFFQENAISSTEPTPNVDISFRFTWQPAPGDDKGYRKQTVFQLVDGRVDTRVELDHLNKKTALVGFSLAEELCELQFTSPMPNLTYADPAIARDQEHSLRIVRVGGQAELFLDGGRLLYVPVDPTAGEPWLFFRTIGSTLVIRDLKFDELIERP